MSFPVDQFASLTKANGEFALKLAEIARSSAEEYLRIGSKAATSLVEQARSATPAANGTGVLSAIEQSRENAFARTRAAVEDWQGAWKDIWSNASAPNGPATLFESLMQPWLAATGTADNIKQAAPAKPQRTAPAS